MGKLEYGIFHGKAIIDAVRKSFSFDELKELALYKRNRISAADVEAYAKKVAERVVNDTAGISEHYECFNVFPDCKANFMTIPSDKWKKRVEKIIEEEVKEEYIAWLLQNRFIPTDCIDFDDLKELDDLNDKDLWEELLEED